MSTEVDIYKGGDFPSFGKTCLDINTLEGFALLERQATLFSKASLLPKDFRGNPANCAIVLNMAARMDIDPMVIFQQCYIINGKPSFSSAFLIGLFNRTKRYSLISYKFSGAEWQYGCVASCKELKTGTIITGPRVTLDMARREGWYSKPCSKWPNMPDLMLRYRAAAFLIRTTMPDIAVGFYTKEELEDVGEDWGKKNYNQQYQPNCNQQAVPSNGYNQQSSYNQQYQQANGNQGNQNVPPQRNQYEKAVFQPQPREHQQVQPANTNLKPYQGQTQSQIQNQIQNQNQSQVQNQQAHPQPQPHHDLEDYEIEEVEEAEIISAQTPAQAPAQTSIQTPANKNLTALPQQQSAPMEQPETEDATTPENAPERKEGNNRLF